MRATLTVVSFCLLLVGCPVGASSTDSSDARESVPSTQILTQSSFGKVVYDSPGVDSEWLALDTRARQEMQKGELTRAEHLFKEAIQKAEARSLYEPGVINSMVGLALLNHRKGNHQESERLYEYAMRNMEGIQGRESTRFADYMSDLAWLYNEHGKPDKAEPLLKHAIAIRERHYGPYSAELETSLSDYARFLKKNKRDAEARLIDSRVKMMRQRRSH